MALAKCWGPRMLRAPWGCHGGGLGNRKLRRLGEEDMNPAVPISQTALSRARRQPPFGVQEAGGVCSPAVGTLAVPSVVNPIPWPLVGLEVLGWAAPSPGGCACCDQGPQADPACGAASQCPPGTWLPAPPPLPPAWHRAAVQNSSPFVPAEAPAPRGAGPAPRPLPRCSVSLAAQPWRQRFQSLPAWQGWEGEQWRRSS